MSRKQSDARAMGERSLRVRFPSAPLEAIGSASAVRQSPCRTARAIATYLGQPEVNSVNSVNPPVNPVNPIDEGLITRIC